jgi:hypothetical protein
MPRDEGPRPMDPRPLRHIADAAVRGCRDMSRMLMGDPESEPTRLRHAREHNPCARRRDEMGIGIRRSHPSVARTSQLAGRDRALDHATRISPRSQVSHARDPTRHRDRAAHIHTSWSCIAPPLPCGRPRRGETLARPSPVEGATSCTMSEMRRTTDAAARVDPRSCTSPQICSGACAGAGCRTPRPAAAGRGVGVFAATAW